MLLRDVNFGLLKHCSHFPPEWHSRTAGSVDRGGNDWRTQRAAPFAVGSLNPSLNDLITLHGIKYTKAEAGFDLGANSEAGVTGKSQIFEARAQPFRCFLRSLHHQSTNY